MKAEFLVDHVWFTDGEGQTITILEQSEVIKALSYALSESEYNGENELSVKLNSLLVQSEEHFKREQEQLEQEPQEIKIRSLIDANMEPMTVENMEKCIKYLNRIKEHSTVIDFVVLTAKIAMITTQDIFNDGEKCFSTFASLLILL